MLTQDVGTSTSLPTGPIEMALPLQASSPLSMATRYEFIKQFDVCKEA